MHDNIFSESLNSEYKKLFELESIRRVDEVGVLISPEV